jgi:hypothetical protein
MSNGGKFTPATLHAAGTSHRDLSRYEMRRECQEILPGLLLGPFQASKSLELLQSLQITHMSARFFTSIRAYHLNISSQSMHTGCQGSIFCQAAISRSFQIFGAGC